MKRKIFNGVCAALSAIMASGVNAQVCGVRDSLYLVELYGANPQSQELLGWDLKKPMSTWDGVVKIRDGCVTGLHLENKNLLVVPDGLENLKILARLMLGGNDLVYFPQNYPLENLVDYEVVTVTVGDNGDTTRTRKAGVGDSIEVIFTVDDDKK